VCVSNVEEHDALDDSGEKLTRYMAAFLGAPNVSVIPQVFLKNSFGSCTARLNDQDILSLINTMPFKSTERAYHHLRIVNIVLPSLTHKPEPCDITAFSEQEYRCQQLGIENVHVGLTHGITCVRKLVLPLKKVIMTSKILRARHAEHGQPF